MVSTLAPRAFAVAVLITLTGCFDDSSSSGSLFSALTRNDNGSVSLPVRGNQPPTISGPAVVSAKIGLSYSFQPVATDPDGDPLVFSIRNKPDWASFESNTGLLSGTPPEGSSGTYTGIEISVSDGRIVAALQSFNVDVSPPVYGSAELEWEAPTQNEDGTALSDLSGYIIRFGQSPGTLDRSVTIPNTAVTSYLVEDLVEGTWYFALSAVNQAGVESRPTGYLSTTIS